MRAEAVAKPKKRPGRPKKIDRYIPASPYPEESANDVCFWTTELSCLNGSCGFGTVLARVPPIDGTPKDVMVACPLCVQGGRYNQVDPGVLTSIVCSERADLTQKTFLEKVDRLKAQAARAEEEDVVVPESHATAAPKAPERLKAGEDEEVPVRVQNALDTVFADENSDAIVDDVLTSIQPEVGANVFKQELLAEMSNWDDERTTKEWEKVTGKKFKPGDVSSEQMRTEMAEALALS